MPVSGTVTNIIERKATTKYGVRPVWDVFVDGTKYNYGFHDPAKRSVTHGATVSFDYTSNEYGNKVIENTVVVLTPGTGAPPSVGGAVVTPVSSGAKSTRKGDNFIFPVPATSGEIAILRQNALTNAREVVLGYSGSFFSGTKAPAVKDIIKAILDVAHEFEDYTSGRDVERAVGAFTAKMEEVGKKVE